MGAFIISEGIVLIVSVIMAAGFGAVVLNQMGIFQSVLSSSAAANRDIALTKVKIVYVANVSSTQVTVWAKNIGLTPITGLSNVDVYFGQMNYVQRIPYNQSSGPSWVYPQPVQVWQVKDTLQFNINTNSTLSKDTTYVARIAAPNGIADEYIFSIS